MRASESVQNYPSKARLYTNYTVREIKNICKTIGPRPSGTEKEALAQKHMQEQMQTCCDKVESEDFVVRPTAYMGWVFVDCIAMLLAVLFFFLKMPVISTVLALVSLLCIGLEYFLNIELLDPFFKKVTAQNVVGRRTPKGEVKQRIIFSGHVDSSYEWKFLYAGDSKAHSAIVLYAFIGMIYCFIVSLGAMFDGGAVSSDPNMVWKIAGYVQIAFVPSFVMILFMVDWKRPVDGANADLTGTLASVGVLKFLQDYDIQFENTEVVAVSMGCSEVGLRGAKAFVKAHQTELSAVPTIFIGLDTLADAEHLNIMEKDKKGRAVNDKKACVLLKTAAGLAGVELSAGQANAFPTDSSAISKSGGCAVTLSAMDAQKQKNYHTRLDTPDTMAPRAVESTINTCLEALFLFDEQGLKEQYDV